MRGAGESTALPLATAPPTIEAIFAELLSTRQVRLLRAAVLMAGDAAKGEDLMQTALVRTWQAKPAVTCVAELEAYVRRALATTAATTWRAGRRERTHSRDLLFGAVPMDDPAAGVVARDELVHALRGLPARARAVVVLRHYLDLSEAETAEALGISVGTVKSQGSKALARLRGLLEVGP